MCNAIDPSQGESTESEGAEYVDSWSSGDESVLRSTLGIINTGNNGDSITPSIDVGERFDRIKVKKLPNYSESGSLSDTVASPRFESTESGEEDILTGEGYFNGNDSSKRDFQGFPGLSLTSSENNTRKKLKQLRPLGTQLIPNHDSESSSLSDTVVSPRFESTESGEEDILTGGVYSEPSPDSIIIIGNGSHDLTGGYSELRPISEIIPFLPPTPSFQFNGFPGLSAIPRSQEAVSEFSRVSSVDGAWTLGSTFELSSGSPFSS